MATIEIENPPDSAIIPEDGKFYEIIDGQLKEKPAGAAEVFLANLIARTIDQYASSRGLGVAVVEILLKLDPASRSRYRPDLIYVSYDRWPRGRRIPPGNAWTVVPDLAVEVVSPSNSFQEIEHKVVAYLDAGVRLVWIISPPTVRAYIYDGPTSVRIIDRDGELDGGEVLPGFRLPMAELFPEPAA